MRSLVIPFVLVLTLPAAIAAQDRAQERRSLGADSLFGPGIVDVAPNGRAAKLRLARPAHVVVFALKAPAEAQLVMPRRPESRASRAGDLWIDLPWSVMLGEAAGAVTFTVARVEVFDLPVGARIPAAPPPAAAPPSAAATGGGTVTMVIVSDSAWSRDAIATLLPREPQGSPMAMAHAIAAALLGSRSDTCAAYIVRW